MTFLITDLTALAGSQEMPVWLIIAICVVLFLGATAASGVITYRLRMKARRKNKENKSETRQE